MLILEVYHNVSAIHEHPLGFCGKPSPRLGGRGAFRVPDSPAVASQRRFNVVFEGVELGGAASRADDEEIGDRGEMPQIHYDHTLGLLLEGRSCSDERFRLAVDQTVATTCCVAKTFGRVARRC